MSLPPITIHVSIPPESVGTVIGAFAAALMRFRDDPRITELVSQMQRLISMSDTHSTALTASMDKLATDFGVFRTDLTARLADLKAQIAAGGTIDFGPMDAVTARLDTMDTDLAAASAEVKAAGPADPVDPPAGGGVVFDPSDPTPNSAGGRNSSQLPGYDSSKPETA